MGGVAFLRHASFFEKRASRGTQETPRGPKTAPRAPQKDPKLAQEGPRRSQEGFTSGPREGFGAILKPFWGRVGAQSGASCPNESPRLDTSLTGSPTGGNHSTIEARPRPDRIPLGGHLGPKRAPRGPRGPQKVPKRDPKGAPLALPTPTRVQNKKGVGGMA